MKKQPLGRKASMYWWIPAVLILAGLNFAASWLPWRIDFTSEKRFTLSESTKQVLSGLDTTLEITVLLAGDIKSEFRKLSVSTRDLLENFRNQAGSKIQYQFDVPGEGLEDSAKAVVYDSLVSLGLRPTNQQVQAKEGSGKSQRQIFPGAILRYRGQVVAIDLLQGQIQKNVFNSNDLLDKQSLNSAEALLEYKFANAIQRLTRTEVPVVGYLYGNGEPPYGFLPVNDVFQTLGSNFIVDTVNLKTVPYISNEYTALVMVKPTAEFSDNDKFKLDQYVMNGGNLFLFIDALYAERDSLENGGMIAYARTLNLNDLLFRYGVRVNTDLVADKHADLLAVEVGSLGGQSQKQLLPWPYAPLAQPGSDHPLVKNQADVLTQFANSMDTVEADGIRKSILLTTSANATQLATPAKISLNDLQTEADVNSYKKAYIPLAVLLEGPFRSLYANRVSQAQLDTLRTYNQSFKRDASENRKIIVVSDADVVLNQVSESVGPLPMGTNKYTRVGYANRDFFQNGLEYLTNPNSVLDARAKDYTLRLLDLQRVANQQRYWQLLNIAGPVLFILLFAFGFQWWRKKRYTSSFN